MKTLQTDSRNIVPGIDVLRPDGSKARLQLHTKADERLVADNPGEFATPTLEQIEAAKTMIALDAADGTLDLKANSLALQTPMHTLFWSDNSAHRMLVRLASGDRDLSVGGRKVKVTKAFKDWVEGIRWLETAPVGGRLGD